MTGIEVAFNNLLAFYFLLRLLRYGYWRDAVWLGLSAGLGLWFYAAFRFTGLALAIVALVRVRRWRTVVSGIIAGLIVMALVFPIVVYSQVESDEFLYRTRKIQIFDPDNRQAPTLAEAIANNIQAHAKMFHIEGDHNGRHNLPGTPMLDPVMGMLMILGIGLALRNVHQSTGWYFLVLLITGLLPGILTLESEAPQSLRTIGVLPSVAYLCALAVFAIGQMLVDQPRTRPLVMGIGVALATSLYSNYALYFEDQRHDFKVWDGFSPVQSILGRTVADYPADQRLLFSPLISFAPTIAFFAPDVEQRQETLILPDALPIRAEPTYAASIFLQKDDRWLWDYAQRLYPNATFHKITLQELDLNTDRSGVLIYVIDLTPADIASLQGLGADGTGALYIPEYGAYRLSGPWGTNLYLDGQLVDARDQLMLGAGNHAIRIEPPGGLLEWRQSDDFSFDAVPEHFLYHHPVGAYGFTGWYYRIDNQDSLIQRIESGISPSLVRVDPALDAYFHVLHLPRPYGVAWRGWLQVKETGSYGFSLRAIEWAELRVNGTQVAETPGPDQTIYTTVELPPGLHEIQVRFLDTVPYSRIHLLWQPPGQQGFTTPPPELFSPFPY
ncbi:MAG: hypothetical protein GYB66_12060 [Chloroflexi bacterium]|nr:hypothetical protein [Chloroflexota bacterium]